MSLFPSVRSKNTWNNGTGTATSHNNTMPPTVLLNDLLIVMAVGYTNGAWDVGPGSWVRMFVKHASTLDATIYYKWADGTEGGTTVVFTTTNVATPDFANFCIKDADILTNPEVGTASTASSNSAPDPPTVSPSWGAADNFFMSFMGWRAGTTNLSVWPTNYTIDQQQDAVGAAASPGVAGAGYQVNASSDNPSAGTLSSIAVWIANTLVIKGAVPAGAIGVGDEGGVFYNNIVKW